MGRMISLIIALQLSLPAYAQVDATISPAGSNAGSSGGVVSPNVSQPKPYRPSGPISGPRAHAGDYEDFCIADQPSSCNFMKHGTVGRWIDEEQQVTHHKLSELQNELSVREAALDKDLAALRSGGVMNGSSYGATVQAKIDATAAAQIRTTALAASRQKILADASAANHAAIDRAVDAADEAAPKSDMAGAIGSIEKSVGSYYIRERLDREFKRADTVEMRIRAEGGQYERDRLILASDGRYALDSARSNLERGLLERSQYALKLGSRLLDVAIDFSPLIIAAAAPEAVIAVGVAMTVSFAKDYFEARTGRRLLGGEMLTGSERSMAMVGAVLAMAPVVGPSYKALAAASEGLAIFAEVSKATKVEARAGSAVAGELAGLDEAVNGASRVLDGARKIGLDGAPKIKQLATTIEKSGVKAEKVTETLEAIGKSDDFARAVKATPANKPMFYVKSTGETLPSTGYRHFDSGDGFVRSIIDNGGNIPAYGRGNYVTFNKFENAAEASSKLQVPHDAAIRMEFDTLHVVDNLKVPHGKWGEADYLEPITSTMPQFGDGGATQAVTNGAIQVDRIVNLKTGEVLFQR